MLIRLAIFPAIISLAVLFGRIFQPPWIVNPSSDLPPMALSTALCIFVLSLSYLSTTFHFLRYLKNSWVLVIGFCIFSISQSLFNFYGADTLTESGPIPLVPVFCLLFSSLSWGILLYPQYIHSLFFFFTFSASCSVLFLGTISIVNAILLTPLNFGWPGFSLTPILSAICFIVFGLIGLIRTIPHLTIQESNRSHLYGALCGLMSFFLTVLFWHHSLEKNTAQISQTFEKKILVRSEKMLHSLLKQGQEFQNMPLPKNSQDAIQSQWHPPIAAEAVIRLKPQQQVIWQATENHLERDLPLLSEQLTDLSQFSFYPSFYLQRTRWFALADADRLLIFSAGLWVQTYFPDELFSHSLLWRGEVLSSNITGSHKTLVKWQKNQPLHLWGKDLILQVTPTHRLFNNMNSLNPLLFLLAGVSFSLLVGTVFVGLLYVKNRISR